MSEQPEKQPETPEKAPETPEQSVAPDPGEPPEQSPPSRSSAGCRARRARSSVPEPPRSSRTTC